MKALIRGHLYELDHVDGNGLTILQYVDRGHDRDTEGVQCQEVLRTVIDRVKVLNHEMYWEGNEVILKHLRSALVLFEGRALLRKIEKGEVAPEEFEANALDGHWVIQKERL